MIPHRDRISHRDTIARLRLVTTIAVALLVWVLAPRAEAGTTQVSLESTVDNMLVEDAGGGLSNGAGNRMFAGQTLQVSGTAIRRALVQFDVAGTIPAGATIVSAELQLTVVRSRGVGDLDVALHRTLADWGEGTSIGFRGQAIGATATTDDATWTLGRFPGQAWSTPGGDFEPVASATANVPTSGSASWSSTALRDDVQAMLDAPATDFGWVVIADEGVAAPNVRGFGTHEQSSANARPVLVIEYNEATPVPVTTPLASALLILALCGVGTLVLRRTAR